MQTELLIQVNRCIISIIVVISYQRNQFYSQ